MSNMETNVLVPDNMKAVEILYRRDGEDKRKAIYLSLRACYFCPEEAARMACIKPEMVKKWREDPAFFNVDVTRILEFQRDYCKEALKIEQIRNLRTVLMVDSELISKAAEKGVHSLTKGEITYLSRIRNMYSPDGLEKFISILSGKQEFNYTEFVLTAQMKRKIRTKESQHEAMGITSLSDDSDNGNGTLCLEQGD